MSKLLEIWVFNAIRQCQVWEELGGLRCVLYMALRLLLLFMLCDVVCASCALRASIGVRCSVRLGA